MNKKLKITLKVVGAIVLLLVIVGTIGWFWLKSNFLDFEGDYAEKRSFKTLTIDGYTFLDRNGNNELDIYEDDRKSLNERVNDILSQLTLEEKIHLLKGSGIASAMGDVAPGEGIPGVVGTIVPTPRLGLPSINLSDGPAGLRIEPNREGIDRTFYCTAFPIGTLLASTWNADLVQEVGNAMGNEALEYGIDVILGPAVNIHRHPFCGRNFEYYSEDPVLSGRIGAAMVNGIESNGVGTAVKHFVANNQETLRNLNDAQVSERAMREIYLKGFEIIVEESQPWTIMSSYNLINGTYVPESANLLTQVLRNEWGFEGLVMSDWFGGQDAVAMINAGNDLLEPGTKKQWKALLEGYDDGSLTNQAIDVSVARILRLIFQSKKMQKYSYGENPDLEANAKTTRTSAAEGMVLLKNSGALPLKRDKSIALLGITSYDFIAGGTGSGDVNEAYSVSLEAGLENVGYEINSNAKKLFEAHKAINEDAFVKKEGLDAMLDPSTPPEIEYTPEQMEALAQESDLAILTIGRNSGEGGDRTEKDDFLLSSVELGNLKLACEAFQKLNKKVIVVMNVGGVVETHSWKHLPDAILLAWQGGQEGGNAVVDLLTGSANPSGKLPMTFPIQVSDHASHANFPLEGKPIDLIELLMSDGPRPEDEKVKNEDYTKYEEGIYVGYRHFDKAQLDVSYPFGFGMSYTNFEFEDMQVTSQNDSLKVSMTVKNIGKIPGKEVIQIYTGKPDTQIDRPEKELKAFAKTRLLEPQSVDSLCFTIPVSDLRYWNESKSRWDLEQGIYSIKVGSSSRDIHLTEEIELR
ncbi:MAG: glycoside hydrolase family 3 C-terminal domain-containing protein [Bacteroidota bacterium]